MKILPRLMRPRAIHSQTICAVALSVMALASPLSAQQTTRSQNDPRPIAHAVRRAGQITIDGHVDEAAWAAAIPITDFVQQDPAEGKPATQRTEIRILFDETALYIGARMYDSLGAKGVHAVLARRDKLLSNSSGLTSDEIALVFDTFRDKNGRSWFQLNPLGVKGDHQNGDASYDPVWEGASAIDSLGWTAEFRIPYSQLRFSRDTAQIWGMQIWRTTDRTNESDMWAFWRKNENGGPPYFGTLDGIVVTSRPKQIELVPYVTSRGKFDRAAPRDPFNSNSETTARVGGDLKLNITSNLTLDATVNPDFGQVEVDPASVNLSAFETTFDEKRPFFTANSQYFSFGSFSCFTCSNVSSLNVVYSRRIGRSPQLAGMVRSRSDFIDTPDAATILGAAKVTGRTSSGLSVGLLDAVTNSENARFIPTGTTTQSSQEVEPLTNYFVGRLRQDYRGGATRIGTIATLVNRRLDNADEVSRLRSHGEVLGFDIDHRWSNRTYGLLAQVALSDIAGDTAAINRAQQSSARYYQRPDRAESGDGLFNTLYDPTRRNLRGYGFYVRLAKDVGDWLWETEQNWRSPGFEVNDAGVISRSDYKWMNANIARQWTTPGSWYRSVFATFGGQQELNFDGDRTDQQIQFFVGPTLRNYWNVSLYAAHHPTTFDPRLTRGGPTEKRFGYNFVSTSVGTDSRKRAVYSLEFDHSSPIGNTEGGRNAVYAGLTLKPSSRILLSFSPGLDENRTAQQYVTTIADASAPAGFAGQRYVFGRVDQRTFSMSTRVNATFTPNLTLELFAQPFLASGAYTNFKEFSAPHTDRMSYYGRDNGSTIAAVTDVGSGQVKQYTVDPDGAGPSTPFNFDNPNFNVRSLRGTAVLRWEYRPGSTLYFVWTQQRDGSAAFGNFDFNRDRTALFGDRPTNVFQVKATYWLGR